MDKYIKQLIGDILNINITNEYLFHEIYGFTFVFRRDFTVINDQLSSAEIEPVGIIYEENGEYYYAPLHVGEEIEPIMKEFVRTYFRR